MKLAWRIVAILVACALVFVGGAVIAFHGEWWFPILERLRIHEPIALEETSFPNAKTYTKEELRAFGNVVFSENLRLINAEYGLPSDYSPALIEYNGAYMNPTAKNAYVALRDEVMNQTGVRIYVVSDYRTHEEQEEIYATSEDGIAAKPGHSEHETGFALDVYAPYFDGERFLQSEAGRMINRICGEYGFILRYPVGKEEVTGISYEPWHLRYVGEPHAQLIMDSGLTLEEYVEFFVPNQWYSTGECFVGRFDGSAISLPSYWEHCEISPDNTGYYLVTLYV